MERNSILSPEDNLLPRLTRVTAAGGNGGGVFATDDVLMVTILHNSLWPVDTSEPVCGGCNKTAQGRDY